MGMSLGCVAAHSVSVLPCDDNPGSRGRVTWPMSDNEGRCLTMDELKQTIRVPLTDAEVFFITKSWKTMRRNMTSIGVAVFLRSVKPDMFSPRGQNFGLGLGLVALASILAAFNIPA